MNASGPHDIGDIIKRGETKLNEWTQYHSKSPVDRIRHQIDYTLVNKRSIKGLTMTNTLPEADVIKIVCRFKPHPD